MELGKISNPNRLGVIDFASPSSVDVVNGYAYRYTHYDKLVNIFVALAPSFHKHLSVITIYPPIYTHRLTKVSHKYSWFLMSNGRDIFKYCYSQSRRNSFSKFPHLGTLLCLTPAQISSNLFDKISELIEAMG